MTESLADRMNWPEIKLNIAKAAWDRVRGRISLDEFLLLLTIGYRVHRPEGYTYDWLRELMVEYENSKGKTDGDDN